MNWEESFFSRLVIAVPEIAFSDELISYAIRKGYMTKDELDSVRYWRGQMTRTGRIAGKLSGKSFAERILIVAPELISVQSVNLMRRLDLIDDVSGHKLRLFVRSLTVAGVVPGAMPKNLDLYGRMRSLAGIYLSQEVVDLYRMVPVPWLRGPTGLPRELSVREAEFLRGALIGAERLNAARLVLKSGDGLLDRLVLVAGELMSERMIRAAVLTGAISPKNAALLNSIVKLGNTAWRTSTRAWNAAGFEQRALIAATGIFSNDMVQFLRRIGIIDARTARTLTVAAQMAASMARTRLDAISAIHRTYRVIPGEAPIRTFARASRYSEKDLLDLLNAAAKETQDKIRALAPKDRLGAKTRAAQERILLNSLHGEMRALWEGVGYLTIIGERNAAMAAVDAMDYLTRNVYGRDLDVIRRSLREAGRAGIDSLISREENLRGLSRRVYKNMAFSENLIGRRIQINLLRGVSAKEFADDVASLIRPNVRGGISYAAQRLARTEINNAFHLTSIRFTREMPWVEGYVWNLSGTHAGRMPKGDVCDDYANDDGYDMGRGTFPKSAVPSKPHPQCLCFTTIKVMDSDEFRKKFRSGAFNNYLNTRKKAGLYDDEASPINKWAEANIWAKGASGVIAKNAAGLGIGLLLGEILKKEQKR